MTDHTGQRVDLMLTNINPYMILWVMKRKTINSHFIQLTILPGFDLKGQPFNLEGWNLSILMNLIAQNLFPNKMNLRLRT